MGIKDMHIFNDLVGRRLFNRALLGAVPTAAAFGVHAARAGVKSSAIKSKSPTDAMNKFLNGIHFYADDMGRQVEANHICTHLNEDFHQCVIFDSTGQDAKLIGVEYIVSERVFKDLPDDEKRLWHSHHYEVKSGLLIAPGLAESEEHAVMRDLVATYGKTWHFWQIDRDDRFPYGIPQLMMGLTQDGQANRQIVEDRDRRFDISSIKRRADRADISMPAVQTGANSWQSGRTVQLKLEEVTVKNFKR
jgi:hypothetical protein